MAGPLYRFLAALKDNVELMSGARTGQTPQLVLDPHTAVGSNISNSATGTQIATAVNNNQATITQLQGQVSQLQATLNAVIKQISANKTTAAG